MATLTLRANSPGPLTNAQVDANFVNLNNDIQTRSINNFAPASMANLLPNSSAELGNLYWSSSGALATSTTGTYGDGTFWTFPITSTSASWSQLSNLIYCLAPSTLYLQCEMYCGGMSSGVQYIQLNFYNAAKQAISSSQALSGTNGSGWSFLQSQGISLPIGTSYVQVQFGYINAVTNNSAIRCIKVAQSPSVYSNEATIYKLQFGNPNVTYSVASLTVSGNTNLNTLSANSATIASLTTTTFLSNSVSTSSVTTNSVTTSTLSASGNSSLQNVSASSLSVSGTTSLNGLTAGAVNVSSLASSGVVNAANAISGQNVITWSQTMGGSLSPVLNNLTVNGTTVLTGNVSSSGIVQGSRFLASESGGATAGYSFTQDISNDTGMFSPSDGVLNFYNNSINTVQITPNYCNIIAQFEINGGVQISQEQIINTNTNGSTGVNYIITGPCTLTLPAPNSAMDSIGFTVIPGVATNSVTINPNGNNIRGVSGNMTIDTVPAQAVLRWSGNTTVGWV